MPDHIHLFISALPRYSPSQLVNVIIRYYWAQNRSKISSV
ncbi:transposase [Caldicellulosiruptor morganii]|uniref:Transposase n=1 Tax=Caldicellulosiruptor morganii TaxID=1387555 RepID=A0ABY7BL07_9FIRM|nr:transposase [Caldicellulosiruptor morganii]